MTSAKTYPHGNIYHSETWRENARLTPHATPAELRWCHYEREMIKASRDNRELLAEAIAATFYLSCLLNNLRETCLPLTGESSSNVSPTPSVETPIAPSQRKPTCAVSCPDDWQTSDPNWPYQIASSPVAESEAVQ